MWINYCEGKLKVSTVLGQKDLMQSDMGSVGIAGTLDSVLLHIAVTFGKDSCEVTHQYFRGHLVLKVLQISLLM